MSQTKERPILFSATMVRAILEGRKTVTRRALAGGLDPEQLGETMTKAQWAKVNRELPVAFGPAYFCPYGQPGDRLWVREACRYPASLDHYSPSAIGEKALEAGYTKPWCPTHFEADGARNDGWQGFETPPAVSVPGKLRPPMFMPRWASRILLEITEVRAERLQAGEGETAAESRYVEEGIHRIHHGDGAHYYHPFKSEPGPGNWVDPFDAWRELWVSINGAESWNANPWVWVVEFKRVTP